MTTRFRLATSAAVPLAAAACAPCAAIARDASESEPVARIPPAANVSSSAVPFRMPSDTSASAIAVSREAIRSPGQGRDLLPDLARRCCSSGRRSSAMWMAVAIWLASVPSAARSFAP